MFWICYGEYVGNPRNFVKYLLAKLVYESTEWEYKYYVADSLQCIPQSKYKVHSLREIMTPANIDSRSGEEIAIDIINKAGITIME